MVDAETHTARSLLPGTRLGRYRVVRRLGVGGMAELYLAVADGPSGFGKVVVLKLVHAHLSADAKIAEMLLREARIAALLDHPNIAHVLDAGTDEGEAYLVMEYIHGRDIGAILRALPRGQPMPLPCALEIARSACRALHYAHTKLDLDGSPLQLVHRDVSPSNVLVSYEGHVTVVDFGIAKVGAQARTTQTGVLKGKFGYMSPEQSFSMDIDCRSDVFALGILLYELTTGRRAFVGGNPFSILNKIAAGDYVAPERIVAHYPARLSQIVAKAMQPDREQRYASAAAMQADLDAFMVDAGISGGPDALVDLLRSLFGEPPFPTVQSLPDHPVPVGLEVEDAAWGRRPWRGWATGVAAVGVAGVLGWWAGSTGGTADARADARPIGPQAASADGRPRVEPETAPVEDPAADVDPDGSGNPEPSADTPDTIDADPPDESDLPTASAGATDDPVVASGREGKRRRARRSKRKAPQPAADPPHNPLEAMVPPSMQ